MSLDSLESGQSPEISLFLGEYEGERNEKDERHGFGRALLPNGDEYEGDYKNGKRNGNGKYTFLKSKARYEGEYSNGQKCGQGKFWYPDGSIYEGTWAEGLRNGYGKYTYANGDVYEGMWKDGRKHGQGEYIYKDKGIRYRGNWSDGISKDHGKLITSSFTYHGTFSGEEPVGTGKFHFDAGCEQEGEYVTKRMVRYTDASREVFHVPHWNCLSLYKAGSRLDKPLD
ncbi:radial spoke head 1 homolog [Pocillopora verrucosa]|uniref:radial spoke head 1 homolog n=1 Tax=Pocillopora verrucosa TaxID=203993 RepID=UPI0027971059|nr:radial spoke head 1 homolog [Pocillopora verrucosa]